MNSVCACRNRFKDSFSQFALSTFWAVVVVADAVARQSCAPRLYLRQQNVDGISFQSLISFPTRNGIFDENILLLLLSRGVSVALWESRI